MSTTTVNIYNPVFIITQNKTNVKTSGNNEAEEKLKKWAEHKKISDKIAQKLFCLGYEKRAKRMQECADFIEYKYCADCGKFMVKRANLCRDRFCSTCQWRLSLQRYGAMSRILDTLSNAYPEASYSLVTLTVQNCKPQELAKTLDKMGEAWHLVLNQRKLKPLLLGTARSVELTYNARTKELHPHYHVMVAWYNKADSANTSKLIEYWLKAATKKGLVANIKAQHAADVEAENGEAFEKAVLETFKYAVKSKQLQDMPNAVFSEVVRQWANKRLVAFTGKIKAYAKLTEAESMEEVQNDEIQLSPCKCCGSINTHAYAFKWAFGIDKYIPFSTDKIGGVTPTIERGEDNDNE